MFETTSLLGGGGKQGWAGKDRGEAKNNKAETKRVLQPPSYRQGHRRQ
nr:MAG TPA: hypothetical protein [Caudoviricetes sp.]